MTRKTTSSPARATPGKAGAAAKAKAAGKNARTLLAQAHDLPPHQLERAMPYLLARAGERMGNTFSKELRPFKLTLNEWRTCVALHLEAHQRLSEIAAHTSADLSTISRVIDGLLKRGLVQRDRSTEDARAVAISLTEEGRILTEKIIPIAQLYERVALSGISDEDAERLRTLLRKVYDNIGILASGA
jgi:DNA-binding MarR family transcriptional regulator